MHITVQGYLTYQGLLGKRQVGLPSGSSLQDLLARLWSELGNPLTEAASNQQREPDHPMIVLLNGRHATHLPGGLNTILQDGDQVAVFPPIAGG